VPIVIKYFYSKIEQQTRVGACAYACGLCAPTWVIRELRVWLIQLMDFCGIRVKCAHGKYWYATGVTPKWTESCKANKGSTWYPRHSL